MDLYSVLNCYDNLLKEYISLLTTKGLDAYDYEEIEKIRIRLVKMKKGVYHMFSQYVKLNRDILDGDEEKTTKVSIERDKRRKVLDDVDKVLYGYTRLCDVLKKYVAPRTLKSILMDEGSLVHLVLTNNSDKEEIIPYGLGGYLFLCQFHKEQHPSMSVSDYRNTLYCFACGISYNLITYFMMKEQLTYQEAVNMLVKIYMIDVKNEVYSEDNKLVMKYRDVLLSKQYVDLIDEGIDKTGMKGNDWEVKSALDKLKHDKDTIERISNGEHIRYSGKKPELKRLVLEKVSF